MRYLVTARLKQDQEKALWQAIEKGSLGAGSIAGDEYLRDMAQARLRQEDGLVRWVEVCFCATPLAEERSYWEEYFELVRIQDAHGRERCRDVSGIEPWACHNCNCVEGLEQQVASWGSLFLEELRKRNGK